MKLVVEEAMLREAIESAMRDMADSYDGSYAIMRVEAPSVASDVLWRLQCRLPQQAQGCRRGVRPPRLP